MKTRVRIILKLLGHKAAFDTRRQFLATIDSPLHSRLVRYVFNLTAERFDQLHFLDREAVWDAENNTVTARNSYEREPDSGVSGRWLDDRGARFQEPLFLGVENHAERGAILDRSARVEPFDFCVNVCEGWLSESRKMKERSPAYEIENAFCDAERHSK